LVGTLVVLLAMNVLTIVALVSERYEAETASLNKSRFLADTSHELRTPLNIIFGASSMMEDRSLGSVPSREYTNYVRMIQQSSEHLLQLIDDLTEISKIEAGHFELREEPVSLKAIINGAVDLINIQARAKGIMVSANVPSDIVLRADARALRQILLNLLSNSVKFTSEGGAIIATATVSANSDIAISITDNGMGIPPESLERVFNPFQRANSGATKSVEGTGLGLSIAKRFVTMHGGTISLKSEVGKGTIATVTFPAERVVRADVKSGLRAAP
jgi:signal transduction histidine kinase